MEMKQMRIAAALGVGLLAAGCSALAEGHGGRAPAVTLVRDGKPNAAIVLAEQPTWAAHFAARELQYAVRKITGARLPLVYEDEERAQVAGVRILVGASKAVRALGLKNSDLKDQEYLIRLLPNTLVLMGRDEETPAPLVRPAPGRFGGGLEFEGGVLTASGFGFNDQQGSMEMWVTIPAGPTEVGKTILRIEGFNPWTYHIVQLLPGPRIQYLTHFGAKQGSALTSGPLSAGWRHVMTTHDAGAGEIRLFVDGKAVGPGRYGATQCRGAALGIGNGPPPNGLARRTQSSFLGRLDELRISSIVRTPGNDAGGGPYASDAHTRLLAHFDDRHVPHGVFDGVFYPASPPDPYDRQGTCHAVHDFLERFCDVRWYGPGELGMVHPETSTLSVGGAEVRRAPAFRFRKNYLLSPHPYLMPSGTVKHGMEWKLWGTPSERDARIYACRLRMGGEKYHANHAFGNYYFRFWPENKDNQFFEAPHPEYFAKGGEIKFPPYPQLCFSNPDVVRQAVTDARRYFDGKGIVGHDYLVPAKGDYFCQEPMDDIKFCKCETCQALLNRPAEDNPHFSNGRHSHYWFSYVNKVAKEIRASHPGKYIAACAYMTHAFLPPDLDLEPNVSVQMCLQVRNWWAPAVKENDLRFYRGWVEEKKTKTRDRRLFLWLYYCFPELAMRNTVYSWLPGYFAHTAAEQIKMFARDGIRGVFVEGSADQVDTYVTFKLLDDPSLDVDDLLDEFFSRYYGAAGNAMRELYLLIERIYADPANYPDDVRRGERDTHHTPEIVWGCLGTAERMAKLGTLMAQALQAARTDTEKKRVGLFKTTVWDSMTEGRAAYLARGERLRRAAARQPVEIPRMSAEAGGAARGDPLMVDFSAGALLTLNRTILDEPTERGVELRALHDGKYIYLQLKDHTDPKQLVSNTKAFSAGDDWELFFAAQRDKPDNHLLIDPSGVILAVSHVEDRTEKWDCGGKVVSDTNGADCWTTSIALPLEKLIAPDPKKLTIPDLKDGAGFYLNVIRGLGKGKHKLSPSLCPTFKRDAYHEPAFFRHVRLTGAGE